MAAGGVVNGLVRDFAIILSVWTITAGPILWAAHRLAEALAS